MGSISHRPRVAVEYPIGYLNLDGSTDYDFVLHHLLDNPTYRNWYKASRRPRGALRGGSTRIMILDNSAYEYFIRGEELDVEHFIKCIEDLQPDYYLLPDVLMDKEKTMEMVRNWPGTTVGVGIPVLQGNSLADFRECLSLYKSLGYNYIAIPFHNRFLWELGGNPIMTEAPDDLRYAVGRRILLSKLSKDLEGLSVHLLGTHHPIEFTELPPFVKTIDTAYAVKQGVMGRGLYDRKAHVLIDDIGMLTPAQLWKVQSNVQEFIQMVKYGE
nr:MAG TPA: Queuine tRNA-ribosyltransferase [Caudoviricetes sp.]